MATKNIIKKAGKVASFVSRAAVQTLTGINSFTPAEKAKMRAVGKDINSRLPIAKQFVALAQLPSQQKDTKLSQERLKKIQALASAMKGEKSRLIRVSPQ